MDNHQDNVLTGAHNKRLNNTHPTNNERTAARTDADKVLDNTKVTVPSEQNVVNAKEWVDNGSRL